MPSRASPTADRSEPRRAELALRYLRASREVAARLQGAPDVATAYGDLLPALGQSLEWDIACLWLHDPDADVLRCTQTWRMDGQPSGEFQRLSEGLTVSRGQGFPGRCWDQAAAIVADPANPDAAVPARAEAAKAIGVRGALAFPIVGRARVLGVVEFLALRPPPVGPDLLDVLTSIGRQAGLFLDRMQAEEELRRRAALLSSLIASAPQAVLAISPDRTVLACNRRFEELWRLAPGTVKVGQPASTWVRHCLDQAVDPDAFEALIRAALADSTQTQHVDVALVDGRTLVGEAAPILDDTGSYLGRIWFVSDDTARRESEVRHADLVERLKAAQRSQSFLLQATRVLAGASGYRETLERLAAVAVPTLGDLCLIDVVGEDGGLRRVAARHADPARQPLVDELARSYPPDAASVHPSIEVIRTGRSRWSAVMSDEFLRATTHNERHFEITKALGFTSFITVPLMAEDAVLGAVTLVSAGSGRRFGPHEVAVAENLATQVAEVVLQARRFDRQHDVARTLQASLLPAALPRIAGLHIAVRYAAGTKDAEVGGDWYDVLAFPDGSAGLAVGDVAGHDVSAAAAMGQLRSAGRALAGHASGAADLLRLLHHSWDHLDIERMATMVVARVEPVSGELTVASAGHPPPLLVSGSSACFLPVAPSAPLAAVPGPVPEWRGVLARGDVLLLYTDGLVEDREVDLDTGMARLAAVATGPPHGPDAVCERVLAALTEDRADDVAMLAVSRD